MSTSFMEAHTRGIGEFVHQRRYFRVPDHQRDFAWTDEEVEEFLSDVIGSLQNAEDDYFLGLIVVVQPKDDGVWEILDGQQRLATTTMVYAAIREWLYSAGFVEDAITIQGNFIGPKELGETEIAPRLTLNINNRAAFREIVVDRHNEEYLRSRRGAAPRHSPERLLIEAALICRDRISKLATQSGPEPEDQAKTLFELANFLRDKVKIVVMEVASTANAYVIFETLNDRGLDLSVLDLVKNYLFGRSAHRLDEVQSNWITMLSDIAGKQADDFLKVCWTSRWGRVQRGRLFEEWRTKFSALQPNDVVKLSADLRLAGNRFSALEVPDHDVWSPYSSDSRKLVKLLSMLGSRQTWPVILSALESFDIDDMERLLKHLIVLIVRYQTVGKRRTGLLEIASARIARDIYSGELNSAHKVWNEYSQLVPNDEEFLEDFSRWTESKSVRARYILAELEKAEFKRNHDGAEPEILPQWEELTLEHVFPVNGGNEWSEEMKADPGLRQEYAHRVGNLCLLGGKPNKEGSSKAFSFKREHIYAKSKITLTSAIAQDYAHWDRSSIENRQEQLGPLALIAWPLPPK